MPSPSDFRRAFGLGQGEVLGDHWLITSSKVGHDVKEQNERYEFPTQLVLEWQGGVGEAEQAGGGGGKQAAGRQRRSLAAAFKAQTKEPRIVYSAYGSPYECKFVGSPAVAELPEEEAGDEGVGGGAATLRMTCLGRATRRRDIPTRQQEAQAEGEARGQQELSKEEERRFLSGYRVIKSRFGTSRCALCGEVIDAGIKIAKKEGAGGRGGWAHAICVVAHVRGGGGDRAEEAEEEEEEAEGGREEAGRSKGEQKQPSGRGRKRQAAGRGEQQAAGRGRPRRTAVEEGEQEGGAVQEAEIGGRASKARGRGRRRANAEE